MELLPIKAFFCNVCPSIKARLIQDDRVRSENKTPRRPWDIYCTGGMHDQCRPRVKGVCALVKNDTYMSTWPHSQTCCYPPIHCMTYLYMASAPCIHSSLWMNRTRTINFIMQSAFRNGCFPGILIQTRSRLKWAPMPQSRPWSASLFFAAGAGIRSIQSRSPSVESAPCQPAHWKPLCQPFFLKAALSKLQSCLAWRPKAFSWMRCHSSSLRWPGHGRQTSSLSRCRLHQRGPATRTNG